MNYTFFDRNNGQFGELGASGIQALLEREYGSVGQDGLVLPSPISAAIDLIPKLKAGQYCYAGKYVITAVIGGVIV